MRKLIAKFLIENFKTQPKIVQVILYCLVSFVVFPLVLYFPIYPYVAPTFIDGELLVSNDRNRKIPIPNSALEINVKPGRWVRLYTKTDGRFTLPLPREFPWGSIRVRFYPSGFVEGAYETMIPYRHLFSGEVSLEYSEGSGLQRPFIYNKNVEFEFEFPFIQSAFAEVRSNLYGDTISEPVMDGIGNFIRSSISQRLNRQIDSSLMVASFSDAGISNVDLAFLFSDIRVEYGIEINSDVWVYAESLEDVVNFSREEFYRYRPWGEHDSMRIEKMIELFDISKTLYSESLYQDYQDARLLRKSNKTYVAINILNDIVSEEGDFYLAWFDLGLAYRSIGKIDDSNAAFLRAIQLNENQGLDHPAVYNTYGRFLYWQCRPAEAITYLEKALEIDPEYGYTRQYILDAKELMSGDNLLDSCN